MKMHEITALKRNSCTFLGLERAEKYDKSFCQFAKAAF